MALVEFQNVTRVLKEGGTLIAPTFIHGAGFGYNFRTRLMYLIGFKTYSKWSAESFVEYIKSYGYEIKEQTVMGSNITPLCCLIAKKGQYMDNDRLKNKKRARK